MRKKHVMHVARARLKLWWNHQISTVCHLWLSACGRNARSLPYFLLPRLSFPRSCWPCWHVRNALSGGSVLLSGLGSAALLARGVGTSIPSPAGGLRVVGLSASARRSEVHCCGRFGPTTWVIQCVQSACVKGWSLSSAKSDRRKVWRLKGPRYDCYGPWEFY